MRASYLPALAFLFVSCTWACVLLPTLYLSLKLSGLLCMHPETWLHFLLNDYPAAFLGSCFPTTVTEPTWWGPPFHGCQLHLGKEENSRQHKAGKSVGEDKGTSRYSATVFLETTDPLDVPCTFATIARSKGAKVLLFLLVLSGVLPVNYHRKNKGLAFSLNTALAASWRQCWSPAEPSVTLLLFLVETL